MATEPALATNYTFTAINGAWSTPGNWSAPGMPPNGGETDALISIPPGGGTAYSTNDLPGNFMLNRIQNPAANTVNVYGNPLLFTNSSTAVAPVITNASGGSPFQIYNNIILAANLTVSGGGGPVILYGNISETAVSGLTVSSGTLRLSSTNNSYTGKTIVLGGTLTVNVPWTLAGVNGPLGAPTGANSTIDLYNGVTFQSGWGQNTVNNITDRSFNLAGTGAGTVTIRVNDNDTGFQFGGVTGTGTGSKTLALYVGTGNGDRTYMTFTGPVENMSDSSPLSLSVSFNPQASGDGKLYLKATNTFSGSISLTGSAGGNPSTLFLSGGGLLMNGISTNTISLAVNTIFNHASSANQVLSGLISGAGGLSVSGTGTLTLTGANTYSGDTAVSAGRLIISNQYALVNSALNYTGGTVSFGAGSTAYQFGGLKGSSSLVLTNLNNEAVTLTLNNTASTTYSGILSDNNLGCSLIIAGTGVQTFTGANNYSGGTIVSGGFLAASNNLAFSTNVVTMSGGGLSAASGSWTIANNINLADNAPINTMGANLTLSGTIASAYAGSLNKLGAGTLTLSGANTYTDIITVSSGAVAIAGTSSLPGWDTSGRYSVSAGAVLAVGNSVSDGNIATMLATSNFAPGSSLGFDTTAGNRSSSATFADTVNGMLSLTKIGANTLTFSGANNCSGGTVINAGTFKLGVAGAIPAGGAVNVAGGIYDLNTYTANNGPITMSSGLITNGTLNGASYTFSGGTVSAALGGSGALTNINGTTTLTGANTYSGGTVITGGSTLNLNRQTGSVNTSGALTFSSTGTFNVDNVGASGALSQNMGTLTFSSGHGTVKTTRTAAQNVLITFSSLAARAAGASGSFSLAGTYGSANGVSITGLSAGFIDIGLFDEVNNAFLWYDSGGYVRTINYGVDSGTFTTAGSVASIDSIAHAQAVNTVTAQTNVIFTTFRMGATVTLVAGNTITVNSLIKTGAGGGVAINGGANSGIQAPFNAELFIRGHENDINVPILANGVNKVIFAGGGSTRFNTGNFHTGGTYVNSGNFSVQTGSTNVFGTGPVTINGTASISINAGPAYANPFTLNDFAGITTGGGGNGLTFNSNFVVNGDNYMSMYGDQNYVLRFNGVISGAGKFRFYQADTCYINNTNTISGGMYLYNGKLLLSNTNALGNGPFYMAGGTLTANGVLAGGTGVTNSITIMSNAVFNVGNHMLLSGVLDGSANLVKIGNSNLVLSGANTFNGSMIISNGLLVVSNSLALQNTTLNFSNISAGASVCFAPGITNYTLGSLAGTNNLVMTNMAGAVINLSVGNSLSPGSIYAGVLSGSGSLRKVGTSKFTLSNTNTYTGSTIVSNGTLCLASGGAIPASSNITVSSGAILMIQNTNNVIPDAASVYLSGKMYLASGVNEAISVLYFGTTNMWAGTWGSSSSSAAFKNDAYFTGSGILNVISGMPGTVFEFK